LFTRMYLYVHQAV